MKSIFKSKHNATRIYRVENLNPEKKMFSSFRESEDGTEYTVCLYLNNKPLKRSKFPNKRSALELFGKYRTQYKAKG